MQFLGKLTEPVSSRVIVKARETSALRNMQNDFLEFMHFITPLRFHDDVTDLLIRMKFNPNSNKPEQIAAAEALFGTDGGGLLNDIFLHNLAAIQNPTEENQQGVGFILDIDGREIPIDPRHHYIRYIMQDIYEQQQEIEKIHGELFNLKRPPKIKADYTPHIPSRVQYVSGTKTKDSLGFLRRRNKSGVVSEMLRPAEQRRRRSRRRSRSRRSKRSRRRNR